MKMYILVNKDIEISKGKLAGQVSHSVASYMYSKLKEGKDLDKLTEYMEDNQTKVILRATQNQLIKLEDSQEYWVVRDLGKTELEPNTLTCICLGVEGIDEIPKLVKKLQLYK